MPLLVGKVGFPPTRKRATSSFRFQSFLRPAFIFSPLPHNKRIKSITEILCALTN